MDPIIEFVKKCFCIPEVAWVIVSLCWFVAAFLAWGGLLILFRGVFQNKERVGRKLIEAMRFPFLILLFEIGAMIAAKFIGLEEWFDSLVSQTLNILLIATFGWVLGVASSTAFKHSMHKLQNDINDLTRRSTFTQLLFLYRISLFTIVLLALGAILLTFPNIKSIGVGILGSAGIAGIALGVAARPILLNLMAGFQIAFSKTIKINDALIVEGDFARVESIHLTHVVMCTWDLRRIILPISFFIDHPFQNWDKTSPELLGSVFLYCDYNVPVDIVRKKVEEIVENSPHWNGNVWKVHVTDLKEKTMELRIIMTADDAGTAFQLRAQVREELVDYLKKHYPESFPCLRIKDSPKQPPLQG